MGFWNPSSSSESSSTRRRRRHHTSSQGPQSRPQPRSQPSRSNWFSTGASAYSGSSSRGRSSRARPRSGFVARVRRFLAELYGYMRRHPFKVFVLVIMPLITGGALSKLFGAVGLKLPAGLEQLVGARGRPDGVFERERFYARGGARDFSGGSALPGMGGGLGQSIGGLVSLAKMFM